MFTQPNQSDPLKLKKMKRTKKKKSLEPQAIYNFTVNFKSRIYIRGG